MYAQQINEMKNLQSINTQEYTLSTFLINSRWTDRQTDHAIVTSVMLSAMPPNNNLYNKRRYVCLSVSMFRMAGQTAGPTETKLDTRTHVHPGSVSVKVNVKVIHVCVRE